MTGTDFQIVKTPSVFKVDESFTDERFLKIRVAVMHTGENLNKSDFSLKTIKDAKDSFKNIAVLANVISYTDDEGNEHLDYGGHDAFVEEDKFNEGQYRLIYEEKVVGIVPETNNFEIIHDDESDKDFVYVDALLYRDYGNYAADILEAKGGKTDVSAEIYTPQISFDASRGVVVVDKMVMSGITLLGEDVNPAMKGANAQVFSMSDEDRQTQMIKVMQELTEALHKYTAATGENNKEGGEPELKFQELLEKYGKTVDDITFEYENLSDEELEAAFASAFEDSGDPESGEEGNEPETHSEDDSDADPEGDEDGSGEDDTDPEADNEPDDDEQDFAKMSVNINGNVREFSVSLKDKINALYQLVNDTYADDCTWYDVDVFDDEKYVIMVDCWSGKGYKQSYKVKKDVYTLVGDRVEVFATWLTQDEINKLDRMKAEYSEISEKLAHYEEEPKKMEILNSEDYSLIADNEEFVKLCEQAEHFNMSVEEVTAKADAILTEAAKHKSFSLDGNTKNTVRPIPAPRKKTKRFGSLFDGII